MLRFKPHPLSLILFFLLCLRFFHFFVFSPRLLANKDIRLQLCLYSQPKISRQSQLFYHQIGWQKLKIILPQQPEINFGDCFQLIGKIQPCPQPSRSRYCLLGRSISPLDHQSWLSSHFSFLMKNLRTFREKLISTYLYHLPYPEADLLAGIVLGAKQIFAPDFYQHLRRTGTLHIVVASGYNLSLIGEKPTQILAYFLGIKPAIIIGILLIWFYAGLVGFDPPVVRAGLMLTILLLARFWGRRFDHWRTLYLTVWLMLMIQPSLITSISFQLSLAALIGVSLAPRLFPHLIGRPLGQELAETVSAQLLVAPIIAWHFGRHSWIAPLVNSLILPLIPWLTGLGLLALLLPWFWLQRAFLLFFTYPLVFWVRLLIDWFGGWSRSELTFTLTWWQVPIAYLLLFLVFHKKLTKPLSKSKNKAD